MALFSYDGRRARDSKFQRCERAGPLCGVSLSARRAIEATAEFFVSERSVMMCHVMCDVNTTEATTGATALMCVHIETCNINQHDRAPLVYDETFLSLAKRKLTQEIAQEPRKKTNLLYPSQTVDKPPHPQQAMSRPRINHACYHVPCSRASMSSHVPMYHTLTPTSPTNPPTAIQGVPPIGWVMQGVKVG